MPLVVNLCFQNANLFGPDSQALRRVAQALGSAMIELGTTPGQFRVGSCDVEMFHGCFGRPGLVACRADDIGQFLAQAKLAELLSDHYGPRFRERFERTGSPFPSDALAGVVRQRIDASAESTNESALAWLADDLGIEQEELGTLIDEAEGWLRSDPEGTGSAGDAAKLALTFVLGHELYHARDNHCNLSSPAIVEQNGFWGFAVSSMSNQQLFCRRSLSSDELRADLCGLRNLARAPMARQIGAGKQGAITSTIAAEMIGWSIATGNSEARIVSKKHGGMRLQEGYLHPVLRIALISEELLSLCHEHQHRALCDRQARNAVIGIQQEVKNCPNSRGEVDDMLLARLPMQIEEALTGVGFRDPESFWCETTQKP